MLNFPCYKNNSYGIYLINTDITAIRDLRYGEGSGPYLLSYVYCSGHQRNLTECNYWNSQIGYHACSSKQDAGVICGG